MDNSVPVLTQTNLTTDGTAPSPSWDSLTQSEQEIVITVVFAGSPGEAMKRLSMTHSTFYRKWAKLKPFYNEFIKDFPKKAGEVLLSQSIKAAQELGKELDSDNEKIRHASATEILDRTLPKEPVGTNLKHSITLTEYLSPFRSTQSNLSGDVQPLPEQSESHIRDDYSLDEGAIL